MKVLVDTSIWSLSLRRRPGTQVRQAGQAASAAELASLVEDGRVAMIGPVRQELLSGIKEASHFEQLRDHLSAFPDTEITSDDYEEAAAFFNRCRAKGIHASNTDFLICAVAVRNGFAIFTSDGDFTNFAKVLPIVLYT